MKKTFVLTRGLIIVVLFCASGGLRADDLLFHVSYNGQTEKASFARGKPESLNFSRTLQYLQGPGVIGAGFQTLDNEHCDYAMPGNFDPRQGALSFWVRAENWRPADKRGYAFFVVEIPNKYKLLLSKPAEETGLALEITNADGKKIVLKFPAATWQPAEWHQIVATWSAENVKLYVDGGLAAEAAGAQFPNADAGGVISINPNNYFKEPASSPADKTSVDEVKVFTAPLLPEQIRREYADLKTQLAGGAYRRPLLTIPLRKAPPTLDGKLAPGEWDHAVEAPLLCRMGKHEVADRLGTVQLMYDAEYLYIGFHATGEKQPLAKHKKRDAWVWEDGAIEFIWETADPTKTRFQFALNSANAIFDMKNNDKEWNGVTRTAAGLDGDGWSAEVALSFKELGVEPPKPGAVWTGNFMHDWDQRTGGYATWAMAVYPDGSGGFGSSAMFGALTFGDDAPAVRLESLGDLIAGKVDARVSLGGTRSVASASPDGADLPVPAPARALAGGRQTGGAAPSMAGDWKAGFRLSSEQVTPQESSQPLKPAQPASLTASVPLGKDSLLAITVADAAGNPRFVYDGQFRPKPPVVIAYQCWPHLKRLDVSLDLGNADAKAKELIAKGGWRGEVRLTDPDGKQTLSKVAVTATNIVTRCDLPFPEKLPVGMYAVRATFPNSSGGAYEQSKPFEVPRDDEVNSTAGMDHTVPGPWTPVVVSDTRAKVINREYTLGPSPFPVQMKSLGDTVLARPVEWFLTTDKGEERIEWDAPGVKKKFEDEVTFAGRGRLPKSGIQVSYEAKLEFDGQWLTTVTLAPPKSGLPAAGQAGAIEIRSLRLEYAVATPSATYVLAPLVKPWENDRVLLDLFESIDEAANSHAAMGHFWLTGLKTGLHFFTPTDGNWVYQKGKPNVRIDQGKEAAKVSVLLIHKPVTLRQPATYTLGLNATPTKPQPRRSWNAGEHEWIFQPSKWQSWVSLVPLETEMLRKGVEEKRKKGLKFFYQYSCAFVLGDNSHYEDYWGATWAARQPMSGQNFGGCPNSTIANVVVAHVERLAREFGIGPYFDMFGIDWCDNRVHGCGYTDSFGRAAKTTAMLGVREEMKRIYRITHRHGCRVFSHNHSLFVVPVHEFSDLWLPGEQYTTMMLGKFDHFYTQIVPRADWLVEMNPFIHGITMVYIPENARSSDLGGEKDFERWFTEPYAWATEQMLTMALPHDIAYCLANVAAKPGVKVTEIYMKHGVILREDDPRPDAIFTGYWDNPQITTDDPEALLSYYTRPDSPDVLAVLSNPTAQDKTVRLKMKSDRHVIRDEYRNEDLPQWPAGITVPHQNFRLLWLRPVSTGK